MSRAVLLVASGVAVVAHRSLTSVSIDRKKNKRKSRSQFWAVLQFVPLTRVFFVPMLLLAARCVSEKLCISCVYYSILHSTAVDGVASTLVHREFNSLLQLATNDDDAADEHKHEK